MQQYLALFRNRNFVLHWTAGAISNLGDFFNSLALVKILSEDPERLGLYLALVMVAKTVPGAILSPIAGVVADRVSRRTIMIATNLIRAVLVLALVFVSQPAVIIALVFAAAIAAVFYNPASSALLPSLVGKDELVTAGSLTVMTQRMAMLIGNALGAAVLIAVGPHNVFYIDSATFVISAGLLALMLLPAAAAAPVPERRQSAWEKVRTDLREALAFMRETPAIRSLMGILAFVAVADSASNVLLIPFFTLALGLAAEKLGFVWALFGGAAFVGALLLGAMGKRLHWHHLVNYGTAYAYVMVMGALITHSLLPSTIFLTLLGLGSGAINVGLQVAVGQLVPDRVRGRVIGAWGMVQSVLLTVGMVVAGALSDRFGPTPVLMGFASFYVLGAVYGLWAFRSAVAVPDSAAAD